jgi:protoporphyrinogen oxidase
MRVSLPTVKPLVNWGPSFRGNVLPLREADWNIKALQSRVEKHVPVAVVGGGAAGLGAAYDLVVRRGIETTLLESGNQLGGNAKGAKTPGGLPFPTGATIFLPGNKDHMKLWKELNLPLKDLYLLKPEIYVMDSERFTTFGTEADRNEFPPQSEKTKTAAEGFRRLLKDLKTVAHSNAAVVVPIQEASKRALRKWDTISFAEFLKPYGKDVRTLIEPYIKSDLATTSDKLSAYVGMSDIEDLNNARYVFPAGNSFVMKRLAEEIQRAAQPGSKPIQVKAVVKQVAQTKNGVYIRYYDEKQKPHVISADHVLMSAPYQEVLKMVKVPKPMARIMESVPKSSYSIVNIFLNKTPLKTYQFYMLPKSKHIADLVVTTKDPNLAHTADPNEPSVMSIYTPHTGRIRDQDAFSRKIVTEILENFPEITPDMVSGVQANPFKYSMAAPAPGQVKALREMPKTFGRVTLINSDGGAIPSILTAISEAFYGTQEVVKQLRKSETA